METCVFHADCERHGLMAPCDPAVCSLYATQDTLLKPAFNDLQGKSCGSEESSASSTSQDASTEQRNVGDDAGTKRERGGMEKAACEASASRMGGGARQERVPTNAGGTYSRGPTPGCRHGQGDEHCRLYNKTCPFAGSLMWTKCAGTRMDVPAAPHVPQPDPESPRDDCRGSLDYMVLGMAQCAELDVGVPVVAVVCGSACAGECASPCAFGMYSAGIKRAHEKSELNKPRVITLPRGSRLV